MEYSINSCYNINNITKESFKEKQKIGMSILMPFLHVFDTFYYMDKVINVANNEADDFWSLEEHYNPIETLFLLCQIKDENHKDILYNVIYEAASKRVGDKNFKARAKEILSLLKDRINSLATKNV